MQTVMCNGYYIMLTKYPVNQFKNFHIHKNKCKYRINNSKTYNNNNN